MTRYGVAEIAIPPVNVQRLGQSREFGEFVDMRRLEPRMVSGHSTAQAPAKPVIKTVGLTVRGRSFYVKWKVPKRLQHIVSGGAVLEVG